jgi:hypothetical protein
MPEKLSLSGSSAFGPKANAREKTCLLARADASPEKRRFQSLKRPSASAEMSKLAFGQLAQVWPFPGNDRLGCAIACNAAFVDFGQIAKIRAGAPSVNPIFTN